MNPYSTMGQARLQPHELMTILCTESFTAAAALASLERQREAQADASLAWLLTQHAAAPQPSHVSRSGLRQRIEAALIRARTALVGMPISDTAPQSVR